MAEQCTHIHQIIVITIIIIITTTTTTKVHTAHGPGSGGLGSVAF